MTQELKNRKQVHADFQLEQFVKDIFHEVQAMVYAEGEGVAKEDKFTEYIMETLAEASETDGQILCPYIKQNVRENIEQKISGYAIRENNETLDLFISQYEDTNELFRLKKLELDSLIRWSTNFLNKALKGHLSEIDQSNEAYRLAQEIFHNNKLFDRVNIFILSNGIVHHDPPKNFKIKGKEDLTIIFQIWDIERLYRLSQSSENREPIEIDFEEVSGEGIPCLRMPSENEVYECYLAIIPGRVLSILYRNFSTRLLESNVRAFLQQTGKINRGIRDTIKTSPEMFLPYNNGLAATAQEVITKVDETGNLIIAGITDFQIVNGGQTTASLFHTEKKHKADLSRVFVQMKLTVIRDEEAKNEIVPLISRYANSQNKVSELDLSSNNPFLQRLEELSRTTYAIDPNDRNNQSIWFFERVKGQYKEALNKEPTKSRKAAFKQKFPPTQKIIKSEVAKFVHLWEQLPFTVSLGSQKNYTEFMKKVEKEFSGKKKPGRIYYEDLVANTILFRAVNKLFGRKGQNPIGDTNLKSYTVSYSLSYFHFLTQNLLDTERIWNSQKIEDDLLSEFKRILKFVYNHLISGDASLVSEYAKKKLCWTRLIEQDPFLLNMGIVSKYLITEQEKAKRNSNQDDDLEEKKRFQNQQIINELGVKFWDGIWKWNPISKILTIYLENAATHIAAKLMKGKSLSELDITNGLKIITIINENKIDPAEIQKFSSRKEEVFASSEETFSKANRLSKSTWNQIIDLGEKTGKLSFQEISVIRTVMDKLRKKESIDSKRMSVVEKAIKLAEKFRLI